MKFFCIPASFFACKNGLIEQLDFSQLRLEHVPRDIVKSRKYIEELLLNMNKIEELPSDLFRCTKIRRLDISDNQVKIIPSEIGALQSLAELNLSKNFIVEIPEEIGYCKNLLFLDLGSNYITGFPKSFVNLSHLASLNLTDNSLTQLPQDIDRLYNLQFLDASKCELRSVPNSIVRLERLKMLDLTDNYISELPPDMHGLVSLESLNLFRNMLTRLPDELLYCRSLRTLDVSDNQLTELPSNIGELQNLTELIVCKNQIHQLPNTIGKLKKLEILKATENCLSELTPSICSCSQLSDLIICENKLKELPASIGNLRNLRFLDLNQNQLEAIPSTIGGCQSLGVLSLRHNLINELPMEIGKLNKLAVLDVADNNLKYLPYTLTVLYEAKTLTALWLSLNQPPLPKLNTTHEPVMNIKVLTCYLLPQKNAPTDKRGHSKSCVGGTRVCFVDDRAEENEEDKIPIGRFERYDTPHPKPFAAKNRHNRNSGDFTGIVVPPTQQDNSARSEQSSANMPEASLCASCGHSLPCQSCTLESRPLRSVLKRRPQSILSQISTSDLMPSLIDGGEKQKGTRKLMRRNIQMVKSNENASCQWTIVGGADSQPYKGKTGLFISKLVPAGTAEMAGFDVDDQLLAVNGIDFRGMTHNDAIELIQAYDGKLEFLIEREQQHDQMHRSIDDICAAIEKDASAPKQATTPERHSFMITRTGNGSVGFTVAGTGRWPEDPFTVLTVNCMPSQLKPGDRIIAVGGTNLKFGARLDQVKTLLTGLPGTRVEIVVERGGQWPPPVPQLPPRRSAYGGSAFSELTLSRSLPSLLAQMNATAEEKQSTVTQQNVSLPSSSASTKQQQQQQARLFQRHPSIRPTILHPTTSAPEPPPRHHRSMSSLIGGTAAEPNITAEILRCSTPIEYPPGEEPLTVMGFVNDKKNEKVQKIESHPSAKSAPVKAPSPTRIPKPASTSFGIQSMNRVVNSPLSPSEMPTHVGRERQQATFIQPSSCKMDFSTMLMNRMEPPLATSSPIPNQQRSENGKIGKPINMEPAKSSHIPLLMGSLSSTVTKKILPPPPVAPKPKSQLIPNDIEQSQPLPVLSTATSNESIELQQQSSDGSPPRTFSSKLKHFEQLQKTITTNFKMGDNGNSNGVSAITRPSAIPLKKPLVSAQDMEKLREAELLKFESKQNKNGDDNDEEEQRDTVQELTRLLAEHQQDANSSLTAPSIVRTKKAELRAERIASAMDTHSSSASSGTSGGDGSAAVSRASSSLSQMAAEIEKRREWRQARLQSIDVESKRTDDLVKLIASATGAPIGSSTAAIAVSNTPSPIPIGP